jgi:hypothetical protein
MTTALLKLNRQITLIEASIKAAPLLPDERRVYLALRPVFARYEPQIRRDILNGITPLYQGFGQDIQTAIYPELVRNYRERVQEYEAETGYQTDLDLDIPVEWIRSYQVKGWLSDAIQAIVKTTQDKVARAAQVINRTTTDKRDSVLNSLLSVIIGRNRMEMIARTETTRARSQAAADYATRLRRDGVQVQEVWVDDRTSNTCPICQAKVGRDVQEVGRPPEHPRCACDVEVRIVEVTT